MCRSLRRVPAEDELRAACSAPAGVVGVDVPNVPPGVANRRGNQRLRRRRRLHGGDSRRPGLHLLEVAALARKSRPCGVHSCSRRPNSIPGGSASPGASAPTTASLTALTSTGRPPPQAAQKPFMVRPASGPP